VGYKETRKQNIVTKQRFSTAEKQKQCYHIAAQFWSNYILLQSDVYQVRGVTFAWWRPKLFTCIVKFYCWSKMLVLLQPLNHHAELVKL